MSIVADIPGLIEGAHQNRGLGFSFLRHIERCSCLLYVIDLSQPEPLEQFNKLRYELNQYEPGLADRPHAIVANKIDKSIASKNLEELKKLVDIEVLPVSAKYLTNMDTLKVYLRNLYDAHKPKELL